MIKKRLAAAEIDDIKKTLGKQTKLKIPKPENVAANVCVVELHKNPVKSITKRMVFP